MLRSLASWALCLAGAIGAPTHDASFLQRRQDLTTNLSVDLDYAVYKGAYNSTTGLNVWKGYGYLSACQCMLASSMSLVPDGNSTESGMPPPRLVLCVGKPPRRPPRTAPRRVLRASVRIAHGPILPYRMRHSFQVQYIRLLQPEYVLSCAIGDEDCLFLNVYAPPTKPLKKLPVLVWIHGGGYGIGDGTQDLSEIINANSKGFIGVAIQYRVFSKNALWKCVLLTG